MSNITPGLQIQWLVRFLRACLRNDTALLSALGTTADYVCKGALEVEPVGIGDDRELAIYVTEFPSICAREMSSSAIYTGPYHGCDSQVRLWYIMQAPIGDTATLYDPDDPYDPTADPVVAHTTETHPIPDKAMADRYLRNVYWRALYWLRLHVYPNPTGNWDLFEHGQIYRMTLPTQVRYRHVGQVAIWEADMRLQYFLPPYTATAPDTFDEVDFTLGDTETPPEGPFVESEVTL